MKIGLWNLQGCKAEYKSLLECCDLLCLHACGIQGFRADAEQAQPGLFAWKEYVDRDGILYGYNVFYYPAGPESMLVLVKDERYDGECCIYQLAGMLPLVGIRLKDKGWFYTTCLSCRRKNGWKEAAYWRMIATLALCGPCMVGVLFFVQKQTKRAVPVWFLQACG